MGEAELMTQSGEDFLHNNENNIIARQSHQVPGLKLREFDQYPPE